MKQTEFDALRQDNVSVLEYKHKFNEMVRYTLQYHGLEELKAKRFVRGLRLDIRKAVRPFGAVTYYEAVQETLLVEQEEYKTRCFPSGLGESNLAGGKQKKPPHGKGIAKSSHLGGESKVKGKSPGLKCPKCKKFHGKKPCYFDTQACLRSGAMDHWIKDCPHM